jgi:hypothetical protein
MTHGWVLANDGPAVTGSVRHTGDGGATWTTQTVTPGALLYGVDSVGQDVWVAGGDPAGGAVVAGERESAAGVLLHSADGGATWQTQWGAAGAPRLSAVDMAGARDGWAVGDGGMILHTSDGGAVWTAQDAGVRFDLASVCALDARTAWVVGDGEAMVTTVDGGEHWTATAGDVVGPRTRAPAEARAVRGGMAALQFATRDAAGPARPTLSIRDAAGKVIRTKTFGWQAGGVAQTWSFRCHLPAGTYRFTVRAVDRAGNRQVNVASNRLRVTSRPALLERRR